MYVSSIIRCTVTCYGLTRLGINAVIEYKRSLTRQARTHYVQVDLSGMRVCMIPKAGHWEMIFYATRRRAGGRKRVGALDLVSA